MSDDDLHSTAHAAVHDDVEGGHGHDLESDPLGPPDTAAWAAALLGGGVGLLTGLALFIASVS